MTHAAPPSFEDQLLRLPVRAKVWVGALLAAGGALTTGLTLDRGWLFGATLAGFGLGLALLGIGIVELRRRHALELEIARARDERERLTRELVALNASRGNVARHLQARGFRHYAVRRWIAAEFGPGDAAG
jgi:hypothetical protein